MGDAQFALALAILLPHLWCAGSPSKINPPTDVGCIPALLGEVTCSRSKTACKMSKLLPTAEAAVIPNNTPASPSGWASRLRFLLRNLQERNALAARRFANRRNIGRDDLIKQDQLRVEFPPQHLINLVLLLGRRGVGEFD